MDKPSFVSFLPAFVRYNEELSLFERILYAEITSLSNKEGYCFAKNSYFAKVYKKSESQVSRAIAHLAKLGFVKLEIENGNERKIYIANAFLGEQNNTEEMCEDIKTNDSEVSDKESLVSNDNTISKNSNVSKNAEGGTQKRVSLVDSASKVGSINNKNNIINKNYRLILDKLNEICGTSYRDCRKNKEHIVARLREGYTLSDFELVICAQFEAWSQDAKMCKFLRPETLFGNKFSGYLEGAKLTERAKKANAGAKGQGRAGSFNAPTAEADKKTEEIINARLKFFAEKKLAKGGDGLCFPTI